jgi:hypothetical protein
MRKLLLAILLMITTGCVSTPSGPPIDLNADDYPLLKRSTIGHTLPMGEWTKLTTQAGNTTVTITRDRLFSFGPVPQFVGPITGYALYPFTEGGGTGPQGNTPYTLTFNPPVRGFSLSSTGAEACRPSIRGFFVWPNARLWRSIGDTTDVAIAPPLFDNQQAVSPDPALKMTHAVLTCLGSDMGNVGIFDGIVIYE